MRRVLVAYETNAGSTAEVAAKVAEALSDTDTTVDVKRLPEVDGPTLSSYDAVVVGAPMILGWHRRARAFLRSHRSALHRVPAALFFTAMQVTATGGAEDWDFPVTIDPRVVKQPRDPQRLGFKERYTTLGSYLRPLRRLLPVIRPVGAAVFAGKLDYSKLKLPQMLFVMLVIAARPTDQRNWELIRSWSQEMKVALLSPESRAGGAQ